MLGRPLAARGEGPLLFGPNSKALSLVAVQCGVVQCRLSFERNVTIVAASGLQLARCPLRHQKALRAPWMGKTWATLSIGNNMGWEHGVDGQHYELAQFNTF